MTCSKLIYQGHVKHILVVNQVTIDLDNCLSPIQHQAIIWTNGGVLLIGPTGINFIDISIKFHTKQVSYNIMNLRMSTNGNHFDKHVSTNTFVTAWSVTMQFGWDCVKFNVWPISPKTINFRPIELTMIFKLGFKRLRSFPLNPDA